MSSCWPACQGKKETPGKRLTLLEIFFLFLCMCMCVCVCMYVCVCVYVCFFCVHMCFFSFDFIISCLFWGFFLFSSFLSFSVCLSNQSVYRWHIFFVAFFDDPFPPSSSLCSSLHRSTLKPLHLSIHSSIIRYSIMYGNF